MIRQLGPQALRIYEALHHRIASGALPPGALLPSPKALATEHGVAAGTVRRALGCLETAGFVARQPGRGTFVCRRALPAVLIVEDEAPVRALLRAHVTRAGYRAVAAAGPAEALAALEKDRDIALVLSDVRMPDAAAGISFIRQVRQRWPQLPLAAVTGYPAELAALHRTPESPVLVLAKPFRAAQIEQALAALPAANASLLAAERRRAEQLEQLAATLARVGAAACVHDALEALLRGALALLESDDGVARLFDPQTGECSLRLRITHDGAFQVASNRGPLPRGSFAAALAAGGPAQVVEDFWALDPATYPFYDTMHRRGVRASVNVPLSTNGRRIGSLHVNHRQPGFYGPAELALAEALATQAGAVIARAQLGETLQRLARRMVEVEEAERRRLARELHDEIGQQLTGLKLLLAAGARREGHPGPPGLGEALALVEDLIARVRALVLALRPPVLDVLGLLSALLWLCERYTAQTQVRVLVSHCGLEQRFTPELEVAAYRIVQEALTNVARHAGVDEATVHAWVEQEALRLEITDRGTGFDPATVQARAGSCGLAGMHERALLLGGHLVITSALGRGTRVAATLPLRTCDGGQRRKDGGGRAPTTDIG